MLPFYQEAIARYNHITPFRNILFVFDDELIIFSTTHTLHPHTTPF